MASVTTTQGFLNSIGVCTHLSYTDGGYNNVGNVIKDLTYLGIRNVRDSLQRGSHLAAFQAVAAAGVKFTLNVGAGAQTTSSLNSTLGLAQSLAIAVPGSLAALEGLNEINVWSASYNGLGGLGGALALQGDLYADVRDNSVFAGVAVDYFTGYSAGAIGVGPNPASASGLADYDTQHPYPVNGAAPHLYMNPAHSLPNAATATPVVYTETGYSSNGGAKGSVNADVQAKYTLDLLCDAAAFGVSRTYLYDLLDAYAPGSLQGDDGFGLFDSNNKPKEVAVALHNLTTLLADPGAGDGFTAAPPKVAVTGVSANGGSLAMLKSTGEVDVLVWDEPAIWNPLTATESKAPIESVNVKLGSKYAFVQIFDPLLGLAPTRTLTNVQSLNVWVTDHPMLVEAFKTAPHP